MKFFTARRICRAGVIAALYVALTYAFGALSYQGFLQIRPAEALCILPLFFPEAIPALYIACMLSNLASPCLVDDVVIGSLATLAAAALTGIVGRTVGNFALKAGLGGLFPVLFNAFAIPAVIVFLCGDLSYGTAAASYWTYFASMLATEALWVYALGIPLALFVDRMRKRGVSAFLDGPKSSADHTCAP